MIEFENGRISIRNRKFLRPLREENASNGANISIESGINTKNEEVMPKDARKSNKNSGDEKLPPSILRRSRRLDGKRCRVHFD